MNDSEVKTNFSLFKTRIYLVFCFITFALGFMYLFFNLLGGGCFSRLNAE